ncbi:hypothetical protein HOD08_00100, partial [bacterium]|nr:hypothetical protein [bacterium]
YKDSIDFFYGMADLVVSRAGAGTIFEIKHLSKKSILVPLAGVADGHQVENAYSAAEMWPYLFSAFVLEESNEGEFKKLLERHLRE